MVFVIFCSFALIYFLTFLSFSFYLLSYHKQGLKNITSGAVECCYLTVGNSNTPQTSGAPPPLVNHSPKTHAYALMVLLVSMLALI
ncbi:hypothetical protein SLEP1_g24744 [Rubroshorea leprosula]|uniref:Uncharacterized protein n=1 Tax=Rubroshorea leprosula TaxID=152421 RepID=A0AAV5JR43_9ROSI|nr:hypothetical protein SLEP1_g24744 [Rubroshorea leprosula]